MKSRYYTPEISQIELSDRNVLLAGTTRTLQTTTEYDTNSRQSKGASIFQDDSVRP